MFFLIVLFAPLIGYACHKFVENLDREKQRCEDELR